MSLWGPVADSNSVKQRSAVEVIDGKHDSLEIVPPDYGRDIVHSLPYRRRNSPKHRQSIVRFQRASVVALNSVSNKRVVIFVEERAFHLFSTVGIPVHRDHVGKVSRRDIEPPGIPVEEAHIV